MPVDWSESRYLDAEPGRFIIAARREKGGQDWYVGGVNADGRRIATVDFSFLTPGKTYEATVCADAENADAYTNPEAYRIYKEEVTSESTLNIPMASGGGFAIAVKQIP